MAYIGRSVDIGMFEKQVLTPDSSTTSFTLTFAVGSANSLLIVYGGVIQEPGVAYSVSGGGQTVVFSEAPATGTTLYVIYMGKQLTTPRAAGQETTKQTFAGDGTTTLFTLTDPPVVPAGIMVFVDGILQREGSGNNYVSSGSTINFSAAPDSGAEIDVYTLVKEKVSIDTVADGSITRAKLAASHPYWDAAGNFGINTPTPTRKLHITGAGASGVSASNPSIRLDNTATGRFGLVELSSDANMYIWNADAGAGSTVFMRGSGSGTESARIDGAGYFYVGAPGTISLAATNTVPGFAVADVGKGWFSRNSINTILGLQSIPTAGNSTFLEFNKGTSTVGMINGTTTGLNFTGVNNIGFTASQNSSSDPNTLDDYEEGTWTPVIAGVTSGATSGGSYGNYTKIGNRVILNFTFVNPNAATLSGSWIVTGLPFPTYGPNSEYHGGPVTYARGVPTTTNGSVLMIQIAGSVSQFGVRWMLNTTGETTPVTGNVPANNLLMSATIVYQTNT